MTPIKRTKHTTKKRHTIKKICINCNNGRYWPTAASVICLKKTKPGHMVTYHPYDEHKTCFRKKHYKKKSKKTRRAITPQGFAKAFYEENK